ncbi:MAG: hypothetical protein PHW76_08165, partial [Alphaproteobacteria bacterium]|nr:hypothetical protein [Alphaproteobacteria bacterium]
MRSMIKYAEIAGIAVLLLGLSGPASAATGTRASSFTYNAEGLLGSEIIEPGNSAFKLTTTYAYDAYGNIKSKTTSGADITTRTQTTAFDSNGQFATGRANALGQTETWEYDARFGLPTKHTGPNGLITTWTYDSFGRKTLEVKPDGTRTSFAYIYCSGVNGGTASCPTYGAFFVQATPYAANGATQNGPQTKAYYDMMARSIGTDTQGFDGRVIRQEVRYDALGHAQKASRPYFLSDGTPRWVINAFDALGRVISTTNPDNTVSTFGFHGLTATVTNALNQTTTKVLNAQGKIASVTDAAGHTTTYAYDPFGNMKKVTDPLGNITSFTYDTRGNKTRAQDPDMGTWNYTYNVLGKLKTVTDAKNQTTTYTYDILDRTTRIAEADRTTTYAYDTQPHGVGSLASAATTDGYARVPTYDAQGRLIRTTLTIAGTQYHNDIAYDANGRVATVTYPSGFVLAYNYTSLGYLSEVIDSAAQKVLWHANAFDAEMHLLQHILGNDVWETREYYPNTGKILGKWVGNAPNDLANYYDWDEVGNLKWRSADPTGLREQLTYDNMNRLVESWIENGPTKTVAYDDIGNIISKSDVGTYAYPTAGSARPHAVQSIAGALNTSYTYDANGNTLAGNGKTYTYTAANMPKTIASGATAIAYAYDDAHQRISQTSPTETTTYLNDPFMKVEKVVGASGAVQWNEYLFAGGEAIGVRFVRSTGPVMRYFANDHLGSVQMIMDETGAIIERLSYDAWGKRRFPNGQDDPTNAIASQTTRGFTNHEQIDKVGLINMNARTYDPVVGRFTAPDSLVENYFIPQLLNRYTYVGNNPLTFTDPTGQCFLGMCHWLKSPIFKMVVITAAVISFNYYALPAMGFTVSAAAAAADASLTLISGTQLVALGAIEGAISGAVLSGNLSGALSGAITGAIFAGVGNVAQANGWNNAGMFTEAQAKNVAMHAAAGGVTSVIQGGKFQSGLLAAGFSTFAGPQIDKLNITDIGRGIAHGIVGGGASVLGGGKFENGAITSSFQYLYNENLHRLRALFTAVGGYFGGATGMTIAGGCTVGTGGACVAGAPVIVSGSVAAGASAGYVLGDIADNLLDGNASWDGILYSSKVGPYEEPVVIGDLKGNNIPLGKGE